MSYNIAKLSDINPTLVTSLRNHCYPIIGLCQQVHRELGPFLNEYMYQEALEQIKHKHYADFLVNNDTLIECKAINCLGPEQRQQLWNYMRLTKISIGILYNFAPVHDQCERYYLDNETGNMFAF